MERPEQIISNSSRLPRRLPANNMRARRGSTGRRANSCPTFVKRPSSVRAVNSCKILKPSAKARGGGACTNGNSLTSPNFRAIARRITAARFERMISGSVKAGRLW
ncbi:hypothetical protein EVA_06020 [gut metagenome]|uniref:Uncharacterized protein n=1 Tax=gut metagenome TaxID=749906 RepID=J9GYF7_9ZZZZ